MNEVEIGKTIQESMNLRNGSLRRLTDQKRKRGPKLA